MKKIKYYYEPMNDDSFKSSKKLSVKKKELYMIIEVDDNFAEQYQRIQRKSWRQEKKADKMRALSLDYEYEDDKGYEIDSLMSVISNDEFNPEMILVKKENERELVNMVQKTVHELGYKQKELLKLLMSGKTDKQIAECFAVSKQAISSLKKKLYKKFKKFLD